MGRIVAVVVVFIAGCVVALSPANARGITYQVYKTGLPTGVEVVREACPSVDPPVLSAKTTAYRHVFGPVTPPRGHASLRVDPAAQAVPVLRVVRSASLASLTYLTVAM